LNPNIEVLFNLQKSQWWLKKLIAKKKLTNRVFPTETHTKKHKKKKRKKNKKKKNQNYEMGSAKDVKHETTSRMWKMENAYE